MAAEIWRDVIGTLALGLIGINIAFIIHPPLPREHAWAWRGFFLGKSVLSGFVALSLFDANGRLGWRAPLATVAIFASSATLLYMYVRRPYADDSKEND